MDRKKIGILIILAGVLIIFAIIYFIFFHDFSPKAVIEAPPEETSAVTAPPQQFVQLKQTRETKDGVLGERREMSSKDLEKIAASFAERFGSYSNQSNYGNITDLKIFMTKRMQDWADSYLESSRGEYSGIYYGIITKAVSEKVNFFDDDLGRSVILVKTQRRESAGSMNNANVYYEDILITFMREDGSWKVDSAFWQGRQ